MTTHGTLRENIPSGKFDKNGQVLYGKKGDRVVIISDHDGVLIVEGAGGRFPVKAEKVDVRSK